MPSLRKGFTLIEILIVIALIGIFASAVTYFTHDARIAQTNAERLANNIQDTIKNARNNMIIGRGVYSGSQLVSTDKRTISIKGSEISTNFGYNSTATGIETSLKYPFYDNDSNYQITDIAVSSGILVNNYAMAWDHTGVTDASITILPSGDLSITAIKGTTIATPINTIRITAGYQGFERSVVLDRVMGRMEVIKGKDGTDNPPLSVVNGLCDNTTQYACTDGTSTAQVAGSCGGSSSWTCSGAGGGSSQSCSKSNTPCPINGACNNSTQFACSAGISSTNVAGSCGGTSTWTCLGQFGGSTDSTCNKAIPLCSCSLPWGGSTPHATSVTAYASSNVTYPATCTNESRTCTNGSLSGSYTNGNCVIDYIYVWNASGFGACSPSCGPGTQTQSVTCQRNDGTTVADSFCTGGKPPTSQPCNNGSCCAPNTGDPCVKNVNGTYSWGSTGISCTTYDGSGNPQGGFVLKSILCAGNPTGYGSPASWGSAYAYDGPVNYLSIMGYTCNITGYTDGYPISVSSQSYPQGDSCSVNINSTYDCAGICQ